MPYALARLLVLSFLLLLGCQPKPIAPPLPATPDEVVKGLFIGNSYFDFYLIPEQVQAMFENDGRPALFRRETQGGFSLAKHWDAGRAQKRLTDGSGWDFVALQDKSRNPLDEPDQFAEYVDRFVEFIQQNTDCRVYLYLTWARKNTPQDQEAITQAYCRLAVEHGLTVAPVGIAFSTWRAAHPDIDILRDDKASHPNELGAYLSACVWYATFTGQSPVGQTHHIAGNNWLTKGSTLADLDDETALMLQAHAWRTVRRFDPRDHVGDALTANVP